METKPAPGDAGTDSGTDDDAKQQSAEERELRNHCKRKAEAHTLKQAAAEGASQAAEAMPAQKQQHRPAPELAGVSCLLDVCPHVETLSCQICLMYYLCTWPLYRCYGHACSEAAPMGSSGVYQFCLGCSLLQRLSPLSPDSMPVSHSAIGIVEG